jgi:hypothetical protein
MGGVQLASYMVTCYFIGRSNLWGEVTLLCFHPASLFPFPLPASCHNIAGFAADTFFALMALDLGLLTVPPSLVTCSPGGFVGCQQSCHVSNTNLYSPLYFYLG